LTAISSLISFILFSLLKYFIAINIEEENKEPETKICPYCLTEIKYHATRCPNCTSELVDDLLFCLVY